MINEIKELLEQGKEVQLECINEEAFINKHYLNKDILSKPLIVSNIDEDGDLELDAWDYILKEEFKYFKIKGE